MQSRIFSNQRISRVLYCLWISFLLTGLSSADGSFKDPKSRFAIDLPVGWKLAPQQNDTTFVFKGDGCSIILQYLADNNDRAAVFEQALSTLKDSGLPNAAPHEQVKDLTVNNNQVRFGLYTDEMKVGSVKVSLYALVGSVVLDKGGIYFLSILNETTLASLKETLEKSFQSIRSVGQSTSGVSEAAPAQESSMSDQATVVQNDNLTLALPSGWVSQDIPSNFEKEIVLWLKSNRISGASITVSCYQGWRYNYSNVRRGGLNTIAAVYPKGQKMLKDKTSYQTDDGKEAIFELWQGIIESDGQALLMQSPMAVLENKNCWLLLIGYASDSSGGRLEEDFIKILKTIH